MVKPTCKKPRDSLQVTWFSAEDEVRLQSSRSPGGFLSVKLYRSMDGAMAAAGWVDGDIGHEELANMFIKKRVDVNMN